MFLISIRQNKILKRRASDSCRRWVCFDEDKGIRAIAYWQGCKNVTRRLAIADAQYATL